MKKIIRGPKSWMIVLWVKAKVKMAKRRGGRGVI